MTYKHRRGNVNGIFQKEYSIVVDFNTLANIEPAVSAVYDMPAGTDLEFCFDKTGIYFIDTITGKRIYPVL